MQSVALDAPCKARRLSWQALVLGGGAPVPSEFRPGRGLFSGVDALCAQPAAAGLWAEASA
eukprot:1022800-Alexandrium_andersonii.AAC.1